MKTHPEPEQLSAYLDGEVEAAERAQIEKHLRACSECSATLNGLRATITAMNELPVPSPSEQDSWALRSAISRARAHPARRYQRWAFAAGSAAAAAIAIVLITQIGGPVNQKQTTKTFAAGGAAQTSLITVDNRNFDQKSASSLLTSAFAAERSTALSGTTDTAGSGGSVQGAQASPGPDAPAIAGPGEDVLDSYLSKIQSCEKEIFQGDSATRQPIQYIVARFKGTPAFILLYNLTSNGTIKTELWVVQQKDCFIRYYVLPR